MESLTCSSCLKLVAANISHVREMRDLGVPCQGERKGTGRHNGALKVMGRQAREGMAQRPRQQRRKVKQVGGLAVLQQTAMQLRSSPSKA